MIHRIVVVLIFSMILLANTSVLAYSPLTNKCIGCHDGSIAAHKYPHNDTVACEQCHSTDVHEMSYIQADGTFGKNKSTAATCIDCHERGVPGFNPPKIPNMKHSSNINNGSIWGSYWSFEGNNISCIYCHGNTKHDTIALGR